MAEMRLAGRISNWNEDKGYGFVVPHDGGERAFVHVKAFQPGSRRPVDGDLISYATRRDERGRTNAIDVRFAGQRIGERRPRKAEVAAAPRARVPRLAIGATFLLAVSLAAVLGHLPLAVAGTYVLASAVSFLMYALDKSAAAAGRRRTPESSLHLVDLLCGWPGGLVAQQLSRHKTVKASFQSIFWVTVVANLAFAAWGLHGGLFGSH